jgi:hypothetical protein
MKRWLPLSVSLLVLAMGLTAHALADVARPPGRTTPGDIATPWWYPARSDLAAIVAAVALALALATGGLWLIRRRWRWPLAILLVFALSAAAVALLGAEPLVVPKDSAGKEMHGR